VGWRMRLRGDLSHRYDKVKGSGDGRRGSSHKRHRARGLQDGAGGLDRHSRENGLSDEELIGELADAAEALREGLS
jgi:hypothetical protein